MKHQHEFGTPDRTDEQGAGIPDQFELDFSDTEHSQPKRPEPHPERRPPQRQRHEHAG